MASASSLVRHPSARITTSTHRPQTMRLLSRLCATSMDMSLVADRSVLTSLTLIPSSKGRRRYVARSLTEARHAPNGVNAMIVNATAIGTRRIIGEMR